MGQHLLRAEDSVLAGCIGANGDAVSLFPTPRAAPCLALTVPRSGPATPRDEEGRTVLLGVWGPKGLGADTVPGTSLHPSFVA